MKNPTLKSTLKLHITTIKVDQLTAFNWIFVTLFERALISLSRKKERIHLTSHGATLQATCCSVLGRHINITPRNHETSVFVERKPFCSTPI